MLDNDKTDFFSQFTPMHVPKNLESAPAQVFALVTPLVERIRNTVKFSSPKNAYNLAKCILALDLLSAVLRLRLTFQLSMDVVTF